MKTCKFCGEQIQSEATKCRFCGEWQEEEKESLKNKNSIAIEYFSVSPIKLVIMSIISLGLYDFYWFYRNWQKIFAQEKNEATKVPVFDFDPTKVIIYGGGGLSKMIIEAVRVCTTKGVANFMRYDHRIPDDLWIAG